MKINLPPGIIIVILGMIGLLILFSESTKELGGKIPLAVFFVFIMIIGILVLMYPKEEIYGEITPKQEIG